MNITDFKHNQNDIIRFSAKKKYWGNTFGGMGEVNQLGGLFSHSRYGTSLFSVARDLYTNRSNIEQKNKTEASQIYYKDL